MSELENPCLQISHVSKKLSNRQILFDINVEAYPGEIMGFLGPNGSGKTTTIKLMLGLLNIDEGQISICGHDVKTDFEAALQNVGGIIENPELYKYLTGRQNIECASRMYGDVDNDRINEVVSLVHLEGRIDDKVSKYSLGMRQRLGLAQALLTKPKLLVLDEPTNGLDPVGIKELRDILVQVSKRENMCVFISSHVLAELDQLCDRVTIIDNGMIRGVFSMAEIRQSDNTDGKIEYILKFKELSVAVSILKEMEMDFEIDPVSGNLKLHIPENSVQDILSKLVLSDAGLYAAIPNERTLEQAFISMTSRFGEGE